MAKKPKYSIKWHEDCAENMKATLRNLYLERAKVNERISGLEDRIKKSEERIAEAKRKGLTELAAAE